MLGEGARARGRVTRAASIYLSITAYYFNLHISQVQVERTPTPYIAPPIAQLYSHNPIPKFVSVRETETERS